MIAIDVDAGQRRGRLFLRAPPIPSADRLKELASRYIDPEDCERDGLIRELLKERALRAVLHRTIDPPDVAQAFLSRIAGEGPPLFATVIVAEQRLEQMLEESPVVFEDFSFQVSPGRTLTLAGAQAALEAWVQRNYPGEPMPSLAIDMYEENTMIDAAELEALPEDVRLELGEQLMPRKAA